MKSHECWTSDSTSGEKSARNRRHKQVVHGLLKGLIYLKQDCFSKWFLTNLNHTDETPTFSLSLHFVVTCKSFWSWHDSKSICLKTSLFITRAITGFPGRHFVSIFFCKNSFNKSTCKYPCFHYHTKECQPKITVKQVTVRGT